MNWHLDQDKPKVSIRQKLVAELGSSLEGISPVTLKDVRNMQVTFIRFYLNVKVHSNEWSNLRT